MSTPKITSDDLAAFAATAVNLPKATADEMRGQVNTLRDRLEKHMAANPGFSLVKMLHAGSVAKSTALRTVNDFDVAVNVKEDAAPTGAQLVPWMAERLRDAYKGLIDPSQVEVGTNCATISFKGPGIKVDVVPVLYDGAANDCGYLVPRDGQAPLLTSVRLHLDFVRARKPRRRRTTRRWCGSRSGGPDSRSRPTRTSASSPS